MRSFPYVYAGVTPGYQINARFSPTFIEVYFLGLHIVYRSVWNVWLSAVNESVNPHVGLDYHHIRSEILGIVSQASGLPVREESF